MLLMLFMLPVDTDLASEGWAGIGGRVNFVLGSISYFGVFLSLVLQSSSYIMVGSRFIVGRA